MLLALLQGLLEAHESVAGHTLADLPACSSSAAAAELPTLLLIDTAGCDFDEQQEDDGDSRWGQVSWGGGVSWLSLTGHVNACVCMWACAALTNVCSILSVCQRCVHHSWRHLKAHLVYPTPPTALFS